MQAGRNLLYVERAVCATKETFMSIRIALIHATPVAMPPVIEAFQRGWPEAETMNLLDDSLSSDLARVDRLDEACYNALLRWQTMPAAPAPTVFYLPVRPLEKPSRQWHVRPQFPF